VLNQTVTPLKEKYLLSFKTLSVFIHKNLDKYKNSKSMLSPQQMIESLNKQRDGFLQIREDSWNPKTFKYEVEDPKIDELSDEIFSLIKEHRNNLSFEFIIEQLTKLGHSPALLYDDDGRFAIICDGYQSVPQDEASDIEMQYFVEKKHWKNSIREALDYYLDSEDE